MDNEGRAGVSEEKGNREIFVGIWFLSAYIYAAAQNCCVGLVLLVFIVRQINFFNFASLI